jgi:hypothetical protein
MFLRLHGDSMAVRLELFVPDLERALKLGWNANVRPSDDDVRARLAMIRAYAESHFALGPATSRISATYRGFSFRRAETGDYLLLEYLVPKAVPTLLPITLTPFFELDDGYRNMVVVEHDWNTATFSNEGQVSLIMSPDEPTQILDRSHSAVWRGFVALIRLGVWHIWIGLDHILFLVALVLPSVLSRENGQWRPSPNFRRSLWKIVKIVTFFTIAHSVTLSLAALDVVHLPSRLIETIIAISIAAAALHNLWQVSRVSEAMIAFVFGLFHGFGFATVLGELSLGTDHLVLSLLGFNLGVEIGQIAIIAAIFPLLYFVRRVRVYQFAMRASSIVLIAIGILWASERAIGFNVPLVPIARSILGIGSPSSTT